MWRDPIVEEVRAIRAAIAKEHGNDLKALARALQRKEGADGRRVVDFSARGLLKKPTRRGRVHKTAQHAMEPTRPGIARRAAHR